SGSGSTKTGSAGAAGALGSTSGSGSPAPALLLASCSSGPSSGSASASESPSAEASVSLVAGVSTLLPGVPADWSAMSETGRLSAGALLMVAPHRRAPGRRAAHGSNTPERVTGGVPVYSGVSASPSAGAGAVTAPAGG